MIDVEQTLLEVKDTLSTILARLDAQPSVTVSEFAQRAGISRTTVHRMLDRGELTKENGKIPFKYLRGFLS
jgi:DNA-binding transcriptional regulator LsrR (DeoR family)